MIIQYLHIFINKTFIQYSVSFAVAINIYFWLLSFQKVLNLLIYLFQIEEEYGDDEDNSDECHIKTVAVLKGSRNDISA